MEGGIFWKKLEHNSNKRGVEGGKSKNSCGGWNFSKLVSMGSTFIREMRVKLELSNFSSPSVMHLSIEIATGIRIGDLSQPSILAALLKITYV